MNDIDLSGYSNWEPIGRIGSSVQFISHHPFCGTFDGKGYSITGLTITNPQTYFYTTSRFGYAGLFGECGSGSKLKDFKLKEVSIKIEDYKYDYTGLAIGAISATTAEEISNCEVEGNINVAVDCYSLSVGGVVGENAKDISNVTSNVIITMMNTSDYDNENAIAGIANNAQNIRGCFSYGLIDVLAGNGSVSCGGICERCSYLDSCVNYSDITVSALNTVLGGISAEAESISNCFNIGNINSSGTSFRICPDGTRIKDCYSLDTVLINGVVVTEDLGADKPNGANLSEEEFLRKIKELFGDEIEDNDKKIVIPNDVWQRKNWTTKFEEKFYTQLYSGGEGLLIKAKNPGHGGLCFGMAYTALMLNDGTISPQSFNRKKVTDILMADKSYSLKDPAGSISALDWIKYAYLYQYSPEYGREENRNELTSIKDTQTFQKLADNIKKSVDNQEYGIINVEKFLSSHTLLAIDYTENADRLAINVYDCNHPQNTDLYLYLYKDELTGKYKAYEYDDGKGLNWTERSFVPRLSFIQGSSNIRSWLLERGVVTLSDKTDKYLEKSNDIGKLRLLSTKQYNFNLHVNNYPVKIEYQNSDNTELVLPIKLSSDISDEKADLSTDKLFWVANEKISYTANEKDMFAVAGEKDFVEFTIPQNTTINISKETDGHKTATATGMNGQEIVVKYSTQVAGKDIEYIITGTPSDSVDISMENQELEVRGFISGKIKAITGENVVEKEFELKEKQHIYIKQDNENISVISILENTGFGNKKPINSEQLGGTVKPGEPEKPGKDNLAPPDNGGQIIDVKKEEEVSNDGKTLDSSNKSPGTGDDANLLWWTALMLSGICSFIIYGIRRRKVD